MITFPNCKINLGLNIIRKRSDGFHDLETIFYPLPFYDIVEIIPAPDHEAQYGDLSFTTSGLSIEGSNETNLCIKAYELLKKDFPQIAGIKMHLHKTIPSGAGLGGGSADASFTLKLLDKLFDLKLRNEQFMHYALQLGSDCPFFISNKTSFAAGKGEDLHEIVVDLSSYKFILVNPGIHIHTANAFAQTTPSVPVKPIKTIIQQPVTTWKETLVNDFETSAFKQFPEIKKIKDELYDEGAVYASMSGSGSTVYGIFEKEKKVKLSFPGGYFIKEMTS